METDALQYLCKQAQDLFEASETVTVTTYNEPFIDGDLSAFLLNTKCFYDSENCHDIDLYIERVETFLKSKGYKLEHRHYGNCAGGPIKGTVIAFRPRKDED